MNDVAIRVEHLSKQYRIGSRERYKALRDTLTDAMYAPFRAVASAVRGRQSVANGSPPNNLIWALKDVSFEVKRGEVLGIIGPNGAGKTTLLKILSRITEPTEGRAEVYGRVGSLLEVGTGFHPELTGRENIYLNGAILGMKKAEIDKKFAEIVAFAEVEKFIDTPVKRYSSGMYVRLAFAVAAHLDPEILVVDEVLAVGDAAFQKKCLGKMSEVAGGGRTVLFVSHNMGAIRALTNTAVWLERGRVKQIDGSSTVVDNYLSSSIGDASTGFYDSAYIDSNRMHLQKYAGNIRLKSVRVKNVNQQVSSIHPEGSDIFLEIEFVSYTVVEALEVLIRVRNIEGQLVFTCLPGKKYMRLQLGTYQAVIGFNLTPLLPGIYQGDILLLSHVPQDRVNPAFRFEVISDLGQNDIEHRIVQFSSSSGPESAHAGLGLIYMKSSWEDFYKID